MRFLLGIYAATLLAAPCFVFARSGGWARIALVVAPAILSCIILLDKAAPVIAGFDNLAFAVALPLLGLAVMALFVTSWRWLFWLVLVLNFAAGAALFSAVAILSSHARL